MIKNFIQMKNPQKFLQYNFSHILRGFTKNITDTFKEWKRKGKNVKYINLVCTLLENSDVCVTVHAGWVIQAHSEIERGYGVSLGAVMGRRLCSSIYETDKPHCIYSHTFRPC